MTHHPQADRKRREWQKGQKVCKLQRKINILASLNEVHKTKVWFKNRRIFNPFQKSHRIEGTIGKPSTYDRQKDAVSFMFTRRLSRLDVSKELSVLRYLQQFK